MHQRVRAIALPELHSGDRALQDHRAILRALRLHDVEGATREMGNHLRQNEILTEQVAALHPEYFARAEAGLREW